MCSTAVYNRKKTKQVSIVVHHYNVRTGSLVNEDKIYSYLVLYFFNSSAIETRSRVDIKTMAFSEGETIFCLYLLYCT
jgi:hypothetical protein